MYDPGVHHGGGLPAASPAPDLTRRYGYSGLPAPYPASLLRCRYSGLPRSRPRGEA